jgi:hypothetical protein
MRRTAICSFVLLALFGSACGGDDDSTAAGKPDTAGDTGSGGDPTAADGKAALEFFQSTEKACVAYTEKADIGMADSGFWTDASYDADASKTAGATVVVDAAQTKLLVDADAGTISSIDGPDAAIPQPYYDNCPHEVYVGAINNGGDPCPAWAAWMTDGDKAHLTEMQTILEDDPAASITRSTVEYLLGDDSDDDRTGAPEYQGFYEAEVESAADELQSHYGCTPAEG